MSTRLVILALLRDQPLHGYEIKHIIEEHMGDWTNIAFGSIYFALGKLAEEGMIEKIATEKEGNRPSRSVYQITAAGRDEFLNLMREVWGNLDRQYFAIDVGLAFMSALPPEEIKRYLHRRLKALEEGTHYLEEHEQEQVALPEVPASAAMIFEHTRLHLAAELAWTRQLLEQVESGKLP
ncbi:MAG TPA: PadR family transcriptional regulator [Longilinea sp.]|nr:PadR family transcriptional regulator [Longilinea sp.]